MKASTSPTLPEYESVEMFVEFCIEDECDTFTAEDLQTLSFQTQTSICKIREELQTYGLTLAVRECERRVRGFTANSHDRWYGLGSCRSHGGSGGSQILGFVD